MLNDIIQTVHISGQANKKLFFTLGLIAVVDALGYGIIIPVIYSYSQKYGLTDFQNGFLFALYSLCAFIATPIIGRLSDKFGRRKLLVISITGTAISFFMAAFAPTAIFLFIARALDGITAGNIPVINAVVTDVTDHKNRAKGFSIIGAAYGFGFVVGPAIAAFSLRFGMHVPFVIAGIISALAAVLAFFLIPETNTHLGITAKTKLFDFKKMAVSAFDKNIGLTLIISLIYNLSWAMFIFAYQPTAVKVRHLTPSNIAEIFTVVGVVGLITQGFLVPRVIRKFGEKRPFLIALVASSCALLALYFRTSDPVFIAILLCYIIANAFINTLITTILSLETDVKSQGEVLGINASYASIGNIFGPIFGGFLASTILSLPFIAASTMSLVCAFIALRVLKQDLRQKAHFE